VKDGEFEEGEDNIIAESARMDLLMHSEERKTANVLIVDDNDFNLLTLSSMMASFPFICTCDQAYNGEEALRLVERGEKDYNLILMDVNMPVMDGFEATKRILALSVRGGRGHVPIVVGLTGFASETIKKKCLKVGMRDVLL